jgi:hypothetical protein
VILVNIRMWYLLLASCVLSVSSAVAVLQSVQIVNQALYRRKEVLLPARLALLDITQPIILYPTVLHVLLGNFKIPQGKLIVATVILESLQTAKPKWSVLTVPSVDGAMSDQISATLLRSRIT